MLKIEGLDALTRQLKEAKQALASLDGQLGNVIFDPNDPESIEAAIQQIAAFVDERLGQYLNNPIIAALAEGVKEQYRAAIIDKASEARVKDEQSDE